MAQEITATAQLSVSKGYLVMTRNSSIQPTMSGTRMQANVQTVGTAAEAIAVNADMLTAHWSYWRNLDATNYVEIGVLVGTVFYPVVKLRAGEAAQFPVATTTLHGRANTAAVNLEVTILER